METLQILEKAHEIIKLANEDYNEFANEYQQGLVAHGEREVDGGLYVIDLSDDHILTIFVSDYSVDNFEVKSKQVSKDIANNELFRLLYP